MHTWSHWIHGGRINDLGFEEYEIEPWVPKYILHVLPCVLQTCNNHPLLWSLWEQNCFHENPTLRVDVIDEIIPMVIFWPFIVKFTLGASLLNTLVNVDEWLSMRHVVVWYEATISSIIARDPKPPCELFSPSNGIVPPLTLHAIYTLYRTRKSPFLPLS